MAKQAEVEVAGEGREQNMKRVAVRHSAPDHQHAGEDHSVKEETAHYVNNGRRKNLFVCALKLGIYSTRNFHPFGPSSIQASIPFIRLSVSTFGSELYTC